MLRSIFVSQNKEGTKMVRVLFDDIVFVRILRTGVMSLVTIKGTIFCPYSYPNKVIEQLPRRKFIQVSKSHFVNVAKIDSIEDSCIYVGEVTLECDELIEIGKEFKSQFLSKIFIAGE